MHLGTALLLVGAVLAASIAVALGRGAHGGFPSSSPSSASGCCSAPTAPAGSTSTTRFSPGASGRSASD